MKNYNSKISWKDGLAGFVNTTALDLLRKLSADIEEASM